MSSYRIEVPQLESVTRAIGYVCVFWAWLEEHLGEMILDLAPLDRLRLTEKEIAQIRDVILVDTDIRTKIKTLRAVAFIRKFDDAWFKQVDKTLNKIDNELRVKRNRAVHSQWFGKSGRSLVRHSKQAKLKRPQSFARIELSTYERSPVKMREMWNLGRSIVAADIKLIGLFLKHDAVQKLIDEEIKKGIVQTNTKRLVAELANDATSRDQLVRSLLAMSAAQNPHPVSPGTRRTNKPPEKVPRQRPSQK